MINAIKHGVINAVIRQGTLLKQFTDYVARVLADSGLIKDRSATSSYMKMAKSNGMLDSIRFAWLGEAGYKQRTSGINTFWTKLYSLKGTNDATQTTSTSQPYLSGNIAPNEKWCLKNPNGGDEYMTHPTISFATNEAWSVTTVITPYGSNAGVNSRILGNDTASKTRIELAPNGGTLYVYGEAANGSIAIPNRKGKRTVLHITYNGAGIVSVSINATAIGTININDSFVFNAINRASGGQYFFGENSGVIIRAGELTLSQKQAEANRLLSLYPEIPSVTIGSQVWATSNCEMVATPMGNLIANVTANATWANSTNIYNTTYAATAGTDEQKTYAAVKAAAMWCYYNNDAAVGAIYGKLYNWYAVKLLQMDIDYYNAANPTTPWGWRVPTDTDFYTLATTLGGASVAGGKMKKDGLVYWNSPNTGADNSSGFTSIGNGYIRTDGLFSGIYADGTFWSQTEKSSTLAYYAQTFLTSANFPYVNTPGGVNKMYGFGIRLIKN